MQKEIRLGVNIDHVATLRNARNEDFPNLLEVVKLLEKINVDLITVHLREDRRHIKDIDVEVIKESNILPLNLEMAADAGNENICLKTKPFSCCLVPEKREELTTEGGLNVKDQKIYLSDFVPEIQSAGIKLSLFVDPDLDQIESAASLGIKVVEIHTGKYSSCFGKKNHSYELKRIQEAASLCKKLGIDCHAGHGLNFENAKEISEIENVIELNVGHFLISHSIFDGLEQTVKNFMKIINHTSI